MNRFWALIGWVWSRKLFFGVMLASAVMFFVLFFPFSDLSDVVTTAVARATGGQVYVQFDTLDLHVIPVPAISATKLVVETGMEPLEAKWAKVTPSLFSILTSLPTVIKAAGGNAEAGNSLGSKIGATIAAEGLLGGDVELRLRPAGKSDGGRDRSRVTLALQKLQLEQVSRWSDLSTKMSGRLNADSDMQMSLDGSEPPEGDFAVKVADFKLPATILDTPMGPLNLPTITLQNVVLRGRAAGGKLMVEEGTFGQGGKDPLFGKLKGVINLRKAGENPNNPMLQNYDLTVDMTATAPMIKDLGIAFILFDQAKTPLSGGAARYTFRAFGQGFGPMYPPPTIQRVNGF